MTSVRVQESAFLRIDEIYRYSRNRWGTAQADACINGLFEAFDRIATGGVPPSRPVPAEFGVDGLVFRYEKHFVYWKRLSDGEIGIVTVLHERMHSDGPVSGEFRSARSSASGGGRAAHECRADVLRRSRRRAHTDSPAACHPRPMHDERYKTIFASPHMVEDLLRGFAAREWAGELDFSTLQKVPAEYVSDERLTRRGDAVWRVRFRDGRHLLVVLEFQSTDDPRMALRIVVYTGLLYQELARNKAPVLDEHRRLPTVLPVVLYNGEDPWEATDEVSEWPKQWAREGREQGMREGLEQGIEQGFERGLAHERALLRRMAASRFGADTAERLSEVLADIADPERLAEVGEWLVRCDTGGEFLARVVPARSSHPPSASARS